MKHTHNICLFITTAFLMTIAVEPTILGASAMSYNTFSATPFSWATVDNLDNLPSTPSQYNNLAENLDSGTTLTISGATTIKTGTQTSAGGTQAPGVNGVPQGTAPNYANLTQANYFGQAKSGADNSQYLSISSGGKAILNFNSGQEYLGLLWGTPDSYNTLSLYNGNTLIGSMTGSNIVNSYGYGYVNITTTTPFTSVVLTSSGNSFEVDNIAHSAFAAAPAAPAPPLTACLAFAGVLLLQAFRRGIFA